jgi:hypothetical protein
MERSTSRARNGGRRSKLLPPRSRRGREARETIAPDLNASLVLTIAVLELESGNPQAALRTLDEIPEDGARSPPMPP